jgi:hypothetical protein
MAPTDAGLNSSGYHIGRVDQSGRLRSIILLRLSNDRERLGADPCRVRS